MQVWVLCRIFINYKLYSYNVNLYIGLLDNYTLVCWITIAYND